MAKRGQGEGTISKRDDGTWWARITVGKDENGRQKRKAFYGKTRREVQERMTAALNDINNDTYVDPSAMKLESWLDIWLNEYKKPVLRPSTITNYARHIRQHIKPALGKCRLKDLRNDMVQRWINSMRDGGYSAGEVEESYKVLNSAIKQAVSNDMLKKSVAENVVLPNKVKPEIMVLTLDEQERLIEAIKADINVDSHNNDLFIMALGTGLRIGELLALTWDDIDFEEPSVTVNKTLWYPNGRREDNPWSGKGALIGPPKTKASNRTVPLMPSIVSMLNGIRERQEADKNRMVTALKNLRTASGYNISEIRAGLDVSEFNIYEWECGAKRPKIHVVKKLADFFQVPLSRLVDCNDEAVTNYLSGADNGSARVTLLTEKVNYHNGNYVFCSKKGCHLGTCDLRKKFRKLCKEAGIRPGMHIHSLRHTFATRGLESGVPLRVMQELLGHSSIKMTADIYTHVMPEQKAYSITKLENLIKF